MATRRLKPEDWSPVYQTRISNRVAHEPRDDFVRISKNSERALRPEPLNILPRQLQSPPDIKAPPPSRNQSSDYEDLLRDPEIVDVASSGTWPRRESPAHRNPRKQSPNIASQYSARQSEISLGILDYYIRDRTPSLHSPELPPPPTPRIDPAIEKFDFGLPPTPTSSAATPELCSRDTKPGAERRNQPLIPISPPPTNRPPVPPKGYSLFPVIKQVTPPPRQPVLVEETINLQAITPTTHHPQPNASYRPRKESISTIGRPRNDSFIKRMPLRILSSDSTSSTTTPCSRRQISTSSTLQQANTSSPPSASRWSDDTIASPPSTAGPRTSFGSLLRRESTAQQQYNYYPDCFFEDDDDEAEPLRRRWRRSPGATTSSEESTYGAGRRAQTPLWKKIFLCGCGD